MEFLIPLMPFLGALPIAVAAIVIARVWRGHRDRPLADLESQNEQFQAEVNTIREELREAQERLDFTERVLAQQRRVEPPPPRVEPRADQDG